LAKYPETKRKEIVTVRKTEVKVKAAESKRMLNISQFSGETTKKGERKANAVLKESCYERSKENASDPSQWEAGTSTEEDRIQARMSQERQAGREKWRKKPVIDRFSR
jgi:hypothetical protein